MYTFLDFNSSILFQSLLSQHFEILFKHLLQIRLELFSNVIELKNKLEDL